jgi:hypothetical protein
MKKAAQKAAFLLSDLGSNQDSPEPKSGVLPVTPSDNHWSRFVEAAKLENIFLFPKEK